MLILKDKPGQLCNRLWAFSPFISDSLENNYDIKILHFYDYYKYFENLKVFGNITFIKKKNIKFYDLLFKILNRIPEKHLNSFRIYLHSKTCITKLSPKKKLVWIDAWIHDKPTTQLKTKKLQILFQPKKESLHKVNQIFDKKKKIFDLIIGVHIRRGDYKQFKNGKYFYSDLDYYNFLTRILQEFKNNKKVTFLLCSNERINLKTFEHISCFQIHDTNLIEDLYGLSKSDYIIGPPSTYSMWASFYGEKPLLFIKDKNTPVKLKDFSTIISQNKFANGKMFSH